LNKLGICCNNSICF